MDMIRLNAYAKINLYLDVTGKLMNGYHSIVSIMQTVSLCDSVTLKKSSVPGVQLTMPGSDIPCDRTNIAVRMAEEVFAYCGIHEGVSIEIKKQIPSSAGLGGGSADGAAVMKGILELFEITLSKSEMIKLAANIGSDIPFFIDGGTAIVSGTGDEITPCPQLPEIPLVIVKGDEGISTAIAYQRIDRLNEKNNFFIDKIKEKAAIDELSKILLSGDTVVLDSLFNRFEQILPLGSCPLVLKEKLIQSGAEAALMSGSGSSVFGLFPDEETAQAAYKDLRKEYRQVYYVKTVMREL